MPLFIKKLNGKDICYVVPLEEKDNKIACKQIVQEAMRDVGCTDAEINANYKIFVQETLDDMKDFRPMYSAFIKDTDDFLIEHRRLSRIQRQMTFLPPPMTQANAMETQDERNNARHHNTCPFQ